MITKRGVAGANWAFQWGGAQGGLNIEQSTITPSREKKEYMDHLGETNLKIYKNDKQKVTFSGLLLGTVVAGAANRLTGAAANWLIGELIPLVNLLNLLHPNNAIGGLYLEELELTASNDECLKISGTAERCPKII